MDTNKESAISIPLHISFMPVVFLITALMFTVIIFKDATTAGPAQVVLISAGFLTALLAVMKGQKWQPIEQSIITSISDVMQACLILLLIGMVIGTWILSGVVPTIIYWGLKIITPSLFLFTACIISAFISLATGSSWSTAGTIGVALMGIASAAGIPLGLAAGAIISGAYFGDKMSPFSETTNLAPSMSGTELFTHIKHMTYTTIPGITIALILFLIIGFTQNIGSFDQNKISMISNIISSKFDISLYILSVPIITFIIIIKKVPAIPALFISILLAITCALIFQKTVILEMIQNKEVGYITASYKVIITTLSKGFNLKSGNEIVDKLLNKGGMYAMLQTIWLILSAMFFAGAMSGSGMLHSIVMAIIKKAQSTRSIITATLLTAIITNILAAEQYLSIVITGRMYQDIYKEKNLHPKNLSRALEDAGTLTSPLVPWNTCGSYMSTTLGVSTLSYLPFAFLNLIVPVISFVYGLIGLTIEKINNEEKEEQQEISPHPPQQGA